MNEGQQPTEHDLTTPAPEPLAPQQHTLFVGPDGLRPFWGLLLYLVILTIPIAVLVTLSHIVHAGHHAHKAQAEFTPLTLVINEWVQFGIVFVVTWVMSRIEDRSVFSYGLAPSNRRLRLIITGAVWGLLFLSLLVTTLVATGHLVVTGILLGPLPAIRYGVEWAIAFLGVGLFEEFFFRGYLLFTLARCLAGAVRWMAPSTRYARPIGFWAAAALISFGFGLGHGSNAGESPIGLLCAGLAGLMFSFSLWRTGSLWWAIGTHAAWDWAQSFLYGVADSGAISKGHLLGTHPAGSPFFSGGLTGPEGSIFVIPVMLLITLVIALTLPKRPTPFDAEDESVSSQAVIPAEVHSSRA